MRFPCQQSPPRCARAARHSSAYYLVLSFSLSLSAVALHGQMMGDHPLPTDWAVNVASSPVTLTAFPGGYELRNRSAKSSTQYTFSCVTEACGKVTIRHVLPPASVNLPSEWTTSGGAIDAPVPEVIAECVLKRGTKVAVAQVSFADGKVWRLSSAGYSGAHRAGRRQNSGGNACGPAPFGFGS